MDNKEKDLCNYRLNSALETMETANWCVENKHYKDAINRCYYAAFYAAKAVLALEVVDFKRHKDVVAYFNKNYIATDQMQKVYMNMQKTLLLDLLMVDRYTQV